MKNILIIGCISLILSSCDSFLKEYSQDLARVETVGDLDELLLGSAYYPAGYYYIASSTRKQVGAPYNQFIHFMSDELRQNSETSYGDYGSFEEFFGYYTWQRQVGINIKGTSVGTENTDWKRTYNYINATNMILDELNEVTIHDDEEEATKNRVEGEARFLRALYYFTLVNLYADPYVSSKAATTPGVPLKLTSYVEDKEYNNNTVAEVYEQIIKDLNGAIDCLSKTTRKSIYRADLTTAYLLTARVYLYMQDYPNARKYAQFVLDRNDALTDLNLFTGTDNVFTSDNPEVIFSMGGHFLTNYIYGQDDYEDEYPFYISEDLIEAFDAKDLRKKFYISEEEYGYYYKKIYWGRAHWGAACSVSDNFLFRTSEAYLILAEACAFDNAEDIARQLLGQLQSKRFDSTPTVNETGNTLIDLIRLERQRELCLEGHRWYDLRRYTVCEKYPWSKAIRHLYTDYDSRWNAERVRLFELEPYDKAYTLAFPKEVLDFQNTLNTNNRPERLPIEESN
ncbi:RagB/SusD family nutrient uptake outer membrane protein [Butyricimonas hominis]|jgi:ragB/susD domain protein|uniref:RagB/SusD family nutrient uptake outer membrane protein n=1 Tax=Butyricimonas hominis TaxID=2763032 RepID=A0ABR7CX07_9BACT|nr:RagB/SusD family nutrient uptake outer membrane protein [Butyricimonas hominis]MBC5620222.1 RagB/SusD family nutrient uptake outer membrane protein [Butyricimonas hominis]